MKATLKTSIMLCAAAALLSATAVADVKSYHGAICKSLFESKEGLRFDSLGVRWIDASSSTELTCPLIRDRVYSTSNIYGIWVETYNASSAATDYMQVTAYTQQEDTSGATYGSDTAYTLTATGALQFGALNPPTYNGNEGSYSVYVTPFMEGDAVYHVYVDERDGDN